VVAPPAQSVLSTWHADRDTQQFMPEAQALLYARPDWNSPNAFPTSLDMPFPESVARAVKQFRQSKPRTGDEDAP
jgi:hypothetical protein